MYRHAWTTAEVEFLESLYKSPSTRNLSGTKLLRLYMTEQARHLPGGELNSSEPWLPRSITLAGFNQQYRNRCKKLDRVTMQPQSGDMEVQVPVQAPQVQQVPVQVPQSQQRVRLQTPPTLQQLPVQAPQEPEQGPILAPIQAPVHQAPRLSLPPGTTRLPAGTICIPGSTTCFPHHTFLLPDQRILLPNGLILARIPTDTPQTVQSLESRALQRATALALARAHLQAPLGHANMHPPLPRIRQVVGRELQGRAHLNATATARASAAQFPQHRQRSAAPRPSSVSLRTAPISHHAAVQLPPQRQRSAAPEPSPRLSAPGSREQPIILDDDEDSTPTADTVPVSASDSRDQTPLFARAFKTLRVDVPEDENSSPTSVVRLADGRHSLPSSPIVPAGPMALGRILN